MDFGAHKKMGRVKGWGLHPARELSQSNHGRPLGLGDGHVLGPRPFHWGIGTTHWFTTHSPKFGDLRTKVVIAAEVTAALN